MKRSILIALVLVLSLLLCACGSPGDTSLEGSGAEPAVSTDDVGPEDGGAVLDPDAEPFEGFTLLPEHANLEEAPNVTMGADPACLDGWSAGDVVAFPLPTYQVGLYNVVITYFSHTSVSDAYCYISYSSEDGGGTLGNLITPTDPDTTEFSQMDIGELELGFGAKEIKLYIASDSGSSDGKSYMALQKIDFILLEADETAVNPVPGEALTDERVEEIYAYMQQLQFDRYWSEFREHWLEYSEEERTALLQSAMDFAAAMGIRYTNDMDAAQENAEWYFVTAETEYCLWSVVCESVGIQSSDQTYLNSIYFYAKGLADGEYSPLHPEILATATDLSISNQKLCAGSNSNISHISRLDENGNFFTTGSVQAVDADGLDGFVDYQISIHEHMFATAEFGDADLLPALQAIGAITDDGMLADTAVQICAVNLFDAKRLFLLFRDEAGTTHITTVTFDEGAQQYVWDESAYTTTETACFNADGDFCYIDESGSLQLIPKE